MSTYSTNLKIELIGTGEQSGTWGATTNTNLGTLIEEAIAGYVTQAVTDGAATVLTIPNGTSSNGRNYVIELTGALTAARTVEVPAVDKPYIFFNNTTGGYAVTVKVSGQTGVTIANGKKAIVYTNSTDVIEVANAPVTEAGTQTLTNKTINGSSNTITNVSLSTGVTGTLPIANGGTGNTTAGAAFNALSPITTTGDLIIGNGSNSATRLAIGANGYVLTSDGTTASWAASTGGVTSFSAGTTGLTPSTGTTGAVTLAGTLAVANGGTGATSLTANNVILGNGTSAVQVVAPGTAGNILTSNGTTWTSAAPAAGGSFSTAKGYFFAGFSG
jgi:hypothetical protein